MRKRDLAARIEALEKRVRTGADYRVMQDQINKIRANMDRGEGRIQALENFVQLSLDTEARIDEVLRSVKTTSSTVTDWGPTVRSGVVHDTVTGHIFDMQNDLPPNGPTVDFSAACGSCGHELGEHVGICEKGMSAGRPCGCRTFVPLVVSREPSKAEWLQSELDGLEAEKFQLETTLAITEADRNAIRAELAAANEHIAAQDHEVAELRKDRDFLYDERENFRGLLASAVAAHARTKELLGEARADIETRRTEQHDLAAANQMLAVERNEARRIAELMRPHVLNPFAKTLPWINDSDEDNFNAAFVE